MIFETSGVVRDDSLKFYFDPALAGSQYNGSSLYDLSGNGNHGAVSDGAPLTSTNYGGTLVLDGLDDQILVSNNLVANVNSAQSMMAWIKYESLTNQAGRSLQQYLNIGVPTNGTGTALGHQTTNTHRAWKEGGNLVVDSGVSVSVGVWYFVCFTTDNTRSPINKIYVNGELEGTSDTATNTSTTTQLLISGWNTPSSRMTSFNENFYGEMGPILVYNKTLTDEEVEQNFNAFRGRYGI